MLRNFISYIKLKPVFAVGILLCCSSLLFGTWVAAIPSVKYRLGMNDVSLGLSLLLSPCGALTGVLLSSRLFSKIPVGKWMLGGYVITSLSMIALINAQNHWMLGISLYCFGLAGFLNGVSVNTTISALEKKYNRKLMSTSHALYSLGGGVSAGMAAIFFGLHISSGWQIVIMSLVVYAILYLNHRYLLAHNHTIQSDAGLRMPSPTILGISFICMVIFMAEGCVADWSAIFLREVLDVKGKWASLGFGAFATAMTLGRLNGDALNTKMGSRRVVMTGTLLACAGFILVATSFHFIIALLGFILIGFGCSGIVPVLFRAGSNIPDVSPVEGFAMVTTGGLIGFLTGPSLIGIISEITNLRIALLLIIVMTLLACYAGWRNQFLNDKMITKQEHEYDEQLY
jgi:MFS family permease